MPDYGRLVRFGLFLVPDADHPQEALRLARLADELGLDLLGIQDHPYQRRFLDTWTLLSVIAAQTRRITLFPDVANIPLRPPAVLAKAAASLDLLSGGRVELGVGAGSFREAIEAMDGPGRTRGEAVDALAEAIQVIRLLWTGQRGVRFEGRFYRLRGVHAGPAPAHQIGIWVGGLGPRMLRLTGELADGWIPSSPYAPPEVLPDLVHRIDAAALAAGRDPREIVRLYNVYGHITDGPATGVFEGPVESWVEALVRLTLEAGMDAYVFWTDGAVDVQLRRFALEVAPAVRRAVNQARASGEGPSWPRN
jgi:alkanesulfonate monooxygenase SsuD/methylene tetrahydromethanopterin reductase-like flavin-dependent oxidoreductase (luciferase family)